MAVNETRPTVADVVFAVKEGATPSSATFIFGCVSMGHFFEGGVLLPPKVVCAHCVTHYFHVGMVVYYWTVFKN